MTCIFHPGRVSLVSGFCVMVILLLVLRADRLEEIFKPDGHKGEPEVSSVIFTFSLVQRDQSARQPEQ